MTETVVLSPSKDNTLYQSTDGGRSNGQGVHLFAGATASLEIRRALLAFDVASQIPARSQITRVVLVLRVSLTTSEAKRFSLHRVTAGWGEGTSNAGGSRDGVGAVSRTGDATWIHRFHPDQLWTTAGGDFAATSDASADANASDVIWQSSPAMIARVQRWLDQPSTNFGWIVIGAESEARTAKRFDSRELAGSETRPSLTVEYIRP